MNFLAELKRRNVIRMAGLYLVGAWLVVQVASTLLPVFDAPAWVMKTLVGVLVICFIPAPVISWVFELTPDGLRREDESAPADSTDSTELNIAQRMNRMIIVLMALALGYFAFDKVVLVPGSACAARPLIQTMIRSISPLPLAAANTRSIGPSIHILGLRPSASQNFRVGRKCRLVTCVIGRAMSAEILFTSKLGCSMRMSRKADAGVAITT
jgi:hypothetical protein